MAHNRFIWTLVVLPALASCGHRSCDDAAIDALIRSQIISDKSRPEDYVKDLVVRKGRMVTVGMALRSSPPYHHYYTIDSSTCKIADMNFDQ